MAATSNPATSNPATSDRSASSHVAAATAGMYSAGLYSAENEHDACGVALVADLAGRRDHAIVRRGLTALLRLEHRGARGAEYNTGDGVGILIQVPDEFLRAVVDFALPAAGAYAVGTAFLPTDEEKAATAIAEIEKLAAEENLRVLGWRDVPTDVDKADLGPSARAAMPLFRQLFVASADDGADGTRSGIALERRTFCLRKRAEHETGTYFPSLSPRTLVYKGMLAEPQLERVLPRPRGRAGRPARWPWCTPGSRRTRSPHGRWRTPTATSRTTARSTPCVATATG